MKILTIILAFLLIVATGLIVIHVIELFWIAVISNLFENEERKK